MQGAVHPCGFAIVAAIEECRANAVAARESILQTNGLVGITPVSAGARRCERVVAIPLRIARHQVFEARPVIETGVRDVAVTVPVIVWIAHAWDTRPVAAELFAFARAAVCPVIEATHHPSAEGLALPRVAAILVQLAVPTIDVQVRTALALYADRNTLSVLVAPESGLA